MFDCFTPLDEGHALELIDQESFKNTMQPGGSFIGRVSDSILIFPQHFLDNALMNEYRSDDGLRSLEAGTVGRAPLT
jgi:hypothetical protein